MRPSSLRRAWRLWGHRLTRRATTTLDGLKLVCDAARVPRSAATAIIKGTYEAPERELVAQAVRPGDRVLELGAGLGVVSLACARRTGPDRVLSYEANAALLPVIQENHRLNGLTARVRAKAISRDGGPVRFFRNANVISSSVHDRGLAAEEITVPSDGLDAVLAEERSTVVVMDIEGAETDLLPVARLEGVRCLIVETHPHIVGEEATARMLGDLALRGFVEMRRVHKNVLLGRSG